MKDKSTLITVLIALALGLGFLYFLSTTKTTTVIVNPSDWIEGKIDSQVVFTEYSDFQCPACILAESKIIKPLYEKYKDKIAFVYKHYPLTDQHQYSYLAAQASEVAGNMGKFWEYHGLLFATATSDGSGSNLTEDNLINYALSLGLSQDKFTSELNSGKYRADVDADKSDGTKLGITGTPSFFVNGKSFPFYQDMQKTIDEISSEFDTLLQSQTQSSSS